MSNRHTTGTVAGLPVSAAQPPCLLHSGLAGHVGKGPRIHAGQPSHGASAAVVRPPAVNDVWGTEGRGTEGRGTEGRGTEGVAVTDATLLQVPQKRGWTLVRQSCNRGVG